MLLPDIPRPLHNRKSKSNSAVLSTTTVGVKILIFPLFIVQLNAAKYFIDSILFSSIICIRHFGRYIMFWQLGFNLVRSKSTKALLKCHTLLMQNISHSSSSEQINEGRLSSMGSSGQPVTLCSRWNRPELSPLNVDASEFKTLVN